MVWRMGSKMPDFEAATPVYAAFAKAGVEAYIVGGAVRDALRNRAIGDIDFAVATTPLMIENIMAKAGIRTIRTGFNHGTLSAILHGRAYEITAFRRDIKTDGRHAFTEFGGTLAEDAARRDFTINAIYRDADGGLHDPVDGRADIAAGRLRFIGDPEKRIAEDYLRILRLFRLQSQLGFAPDKTALAAAAQLRDGLAQLSAERITQEMRKLLAGAHVAKALDALLKTQIAPMVLPSLDLSQGARRLGLVRGDWAAMLVAVSDTTPTNWRLSNAEAARIARLRLLIHDDRKPAVLGHEYGADAEIGLRLRLGREPSPHEQAEISRGIVAKFPLGGRDLIGRMAPGPEMGRKLARARQYWLDNDLAPTQEELLAQFWE